MKFLGYRVDFLKFSINELKENQTFNMQPNIKFDFGFNGNKCRLKTTVKLEKTDENPSPFDIEAIIVGDFLLSDGINIVPEEISKKACELLYPYVRSTIASLTINANLPAYFLPILDFDKISGIADNKNQIKIRPLVDEV